MQDLTECIILLLWYVGIFYSVCHYSIRLTMEYLITVSNLAISFPALIAVCVISLNNQEEDDLCNSIDIKMPYIQI